MAVRIRLADGLAARVRAEHRLIGDRIGQAALLARQVERVLIQRRGRGHVERVGAETVESLLAHFAEARGKRTLATFYFLKSRMSPFRLPGSQSRSKRKRPLIWASPESVTSVLRR